LPLIFQTWQFPQGLTPWRYVWQVQGPTVTLAIQLSLSAGNSIIIISKIFLDLVVKKSKMQVIMKTISLKNLVWKEGKHYVSQALNMEVSSFGKTKKEAVKNLIEAITLYLEDSPKIEFRKVRNPSLITNTVSYV
jgi:predicted RNase H-like HicB family nuclease